MSAITLLGTPAEMYVYGTQYCMLVLAYPFVMVATSTLYLPVFYKLGVSTSYEVRGTNHSSIIKSANVFCLTYISVPRMAFQQGRASPGLLLLRPSNGHVYGHRGLHACSGLVTK